MSIRDGRNTEGLAKYIHAAGSSTYLPSMSSSFKDRNLIAVIGDEVRFLNNTHSLYTTYKYQDSITGLLLAGIGHINEHQKKNFLVVDSSMSATLSTLLGDIDQYIRDTNCNYRRCIRRVHKPRGCSHPTH